MELKNRILDLRVSTKSSIVLISLALLLCQSSCKKLVEVGAPSNTLNSANVYRNDVTAIAVLTGILGNMSNGNFQNTGIMGMSLFPSLSADELTLFGNDNNFSPYYRNALSSSSTGGADFWRTIYPIIFVANSAMEGLNTAGTLTPAVKKQLLGEAEFIRAFCYFYLVNLYGDVPLATGTDYKVNNSLSRAPKLQVYQQIIADLKAAQSNLSTRFLDATLLGTSQERVRPSYWSATALLARAYLYYGNLSHDVSNYTAALSQSSLVINNSSLFALGTLNNTFLKASLGNKEAIWQLQPVGPSQKTNEAVTFILPSSGPSSPLYPFYINNQLVSSFETGDQRKVNWVNNVTVPVGGVATTYYYPYKYKDNNLASPGTEYEMVLRLGEQFLIRAEAEAQGAGNGVPDAIKDLNVIRNRAGLPGYSGPADKTSVLAAIIHERQVELFTEWGHRWLDLKRTGIVDAVMGRVLPLKIKDGIWNTNQQWYPVPISELNANPNLGQNSGY